MEMDGEGAGVELEANQFITRCTDREGLLFLLLRMLRDCSTLTIRLHALLQINVRLALIRALISNSLFYS